MLIKILIKTCRGKKFWVKAETPGQIVDMNCCFDRISKNKAGDGNLATDGCEKRITGTISEFTKRKFVDDKRV